MCSVTEKQITQTAIEMLTITDKTLATSFEGEIGRNVSISDMTVSNEDDNTVEVDVENDDSYSSVMDQSNYGGIIEITNSISSSPVAQQNQSIVSLPPVSPLHASPLASKQNCSNVTNAVLSPRRSTLPAVCSPCHSWYSQSVTVFVKTPDSGRKEGEFENEADVQHNDLSDILPLTTNAERCAELLETPKKSKDGRLRWFEIFERKQEKVWNRYRQTPSSSVCSDYDELEYDLFLDGNLRDTEFKEGNKVNEGAPTSETVERERKENSIELLPQYNFDSPSFHGDSFFVLPNYDLSDIPRFHFPNGIPPTLQNGKISNKLNVLQEVFRKYDDQISFPQMAEICEAVGLCALWKRPFYKCFASSNTINFDTFVSWWRIFQERAHDEASRFVYILTNGSRSFLIANDFEALIQDLIETLPSLEFLKEATSFHRAYIETAIELLETAEINEEREFFSYEHFYVIYCKFFALDMGEKNFLTPIDLSLYSDGALTNLVLRRIFSGAVSNCRKKPGTIVYTEFVNFLLAEVDKCQPKSIEYWFRIMDLNGDGRISFDEMACFYTEVIANVLQADMDAISFSDVVNMLCDMISPRSLIYFTLSDLKRFPQMARYFFNTFVNWMKHILQESGTVGVKSEEDTHFNDWDYYCRLEHEFIVSETFEKEDEMEFGSFTCRSSDEMSPNVEVSPSKQENTQ